MIIKKYRMIILTAASSIAVAGCGYNAIKLDRAGVVSQAGTNAIGSSKLFLKRVRDARDEANIALVASDESCAWGETIILAGDGRRKNPKINVPFCLPKGTKADGNLEDVELSLAPISDSAIKPTLNAIDALAAYIDAVNEILEQEKPDVSGKLADAYEKALIAQSDISAIVGSSLKIIPKLTSDQTSAVTGLLKLIEDLRDEQRKVSDLRRLVNKQNVEVEKTVKLLRSSIKTWGESSLAGDLQLNDSAYASISRTLAATPPVYKGFDVRRDVLIRIVQSKRNAKAGLVLTATVDKTLDELSKAQNALFSSFTSNPQWTKEERQKAAKLNRQRVLAALHSLAAVVTAF